MQPNIPYDPELKGALAQCSECGSHLIVPMTKEQYLELQSSMGRKIQDVIPEVSADLRELLISSLCGKCFDKVFAEDQEAEES